MTAIEQQKLGKILWGIADKLRGAMNADDFRDYMLSFLFLRYLSDNYEDAVKKELGSDYPAVSDTDSAESRVLTPLQIWYDRNPEDISEFEKQMRRKIHYVIKPKYLWKNISELARTQSNDLLQTLQEGFKYIENESFESTFQGLFSEINLNSEKLGKNYAERNEKLCSIIKKIAEEIAKFSNDSDTLGDAYEYLIGQFAAGSGKKAGEFYTPQQVSTILSKIVTLDSQDPTTGPKKRIDKVLDFACGSGSLLLNVRHQMNRDGRRGIGKIYGQEKNITTYNLARMNMLLHGVKDSEFEIFHGDTLLNDWDILNEMNPAKKIGWIMEEPLRIQGKLSGKERRQKVLEMLKKVGLDEIIADRYPNQLSGGQRQRVCIGEALMTNPGLLVADEAVSALDVTIQAQILELLEQLKEEMGLSILFISHDMRVVYQLCDRVMIMKDGTIVESGDVDTVYFSPQHEYTKELLEAAGIGEDET